MRGLRRADFVSLGDIGRRAGSVLQGRGRALAAFDAWRRASGPVLARVARPVALRGSRLVVEVLDPSWTETIAAMAPELLGTMRSDGGGSGAGEVVVSGVDLRPATPGPPGGVDRGAPPNPPSPGHRAGRAAHPSPGPPDGVSSIRDDDLRLRFSEVARRYLSLRP